MTSDHEAEIRAAVAARQDLGPGYDDAVAEGLVERIGAEIDKRIAARLGQPGAGAQGYMGPMLPPGYQMGPPPPRPAPVSQRSVATTVTALGSIALGVVATAVVAHGDSVGGRGAIVLLIWLAIVIINVTYARRP